MFIYKDCVDIREIINLSNLGGVIQEIDALIFYYSGVPDEYTRFSFKDEAAAKKAFDTIVHGLKTKKAFVEI